MSTVKQRRGLNICDLFISLVFKQNNDWKCKLINVFIDPQGEITIPHLFLPSNLSGMSLPKERLRIGLTAVDQISEVIRYAYENDMRLRAVGSGASWSKLTNVRDILMGECAAPSAVS